MGAYDMVITHWIPPENHDHLIEIVDGKFSKVLKGRKTLRKILEEHRDRKKTKDDGTPGSDRLSASQKTLFNSIHKVNTL